jgi:hypothetical protein
MRNEEQKQVKIYDTRTLTRLKVKIECPKPPKETIWCQLLTEFFKYSTFTMKLSMQNYIEHFLVDHFVICIY